MQCDELDIPLNTDEGQILLGARDVIAEEAFARSPETDHTPDRERRLRRLAFSVGGLRGSLHWSRRWFRLCGIPNDAELLNMAYDPLTDEWQVLIRSSEFSIVELGATVPSIDCVIEMRAEGEV